MILETLNIPLMYKELTINFVCLKLLRNIHFMHFFLFFIIFESTVRNLYQLHRGQGEDIFKHNSYVHLYITTSLQSLKLFLIELTINFVCLDIAHEDRYGFCACIYCRCLITCFYTSSF